MRRSVQYLSFNTPVGTPEAMQCGKAVFTDIHIKQSLNGGGGDDSDPSKPFPSGCKANMMTPQAKALEFLFFDLSSCVEPPTAMPQPPIVPPPGTPTQPPPTLGRPPAVPPPPPPPPPPIQDSRPGGRDQAWAGRGWLASAAPHFPEPGAARAQYTRQHRIYFGLRPFAWLVWYNIA